MSSLDDQEEFDHLATERSEIIRNYRIIAAASVLVLFIGAAFFHHNEHWSWLNAFYFCTITLTTVGYGDLVPKTDAGKLFDIFYVIVGIGILAALANTMIKNVAARRQYRRAKGQPIHRKL